VVCAQNSINDETIARIVGYERTVGLIMSSITVHLVEPGHVVRGAAAGRDRGYVVFRVGELNGAVTPRALQIAAMLDCIDASKVSSNLWGERWSKLATNCMGNTLTAMSGLAAADLQEVAPRFPALRDEVVREIVAVGTALGVEIEPIGGRTAADWLALPGLDLASPPPRSGSTEGLVAAGFPPSTLQDVRKGRKTEIDGLNGYVSRRGREVGIATPVNDAIVATIREVESGARPPSPQNVDQVWDMVQKATPLPVAAVQS
jgi:2-dehydropantoate 2-reductase